MATQRKGGLQSSDLWETFPWAGGWAGKFPCFRGSLEGGVWTREQEEMQAGCFQA